MFGTGCKMERAMRFKLTTVTLARWGSTTELRSHINHFVPPAFAKRISGGEGGIRTRGTLTRTLAFQASSLNHSDTSPELEQVGKATHFDFGKQMGFTGNFEPPF